jgi:hypothetical protein
MIRQIMILMTIRAGFVIEVAVPTIRQIMTPTTIAAVTGFVQQTMAVAAKGVDEVVDAVVTTPRAMTAAAMAPTIRHNGSLAVPGRSLLPGTEID